MSTEQEPETKSRRDVKESLKTVRVGVEKLSRDVAAATEKWAKETEKWAKETSPKVAATIDETVEKTAATLKKTMSTINTETRPQQVKLLKSYQRFLSKQVEIIERRIKELTT